MQAGGEEGKFWAMFLVAGGHFAAAIVRVKNPDGVEEEQARLTKKGKLIKPKPPTEVVKHKTFHRYTSTPWSSYHCHSVLIMTTARRKQGGSQGTNDNAKTKAVSAGAMLRRYGEQALRDVGTPFLRLFLFFYQRRHAGYPQLASGLVRRTRRL